MRYVFKTSHDQDIDLLRHPSDWWWYAALSVILLALPAVIPSYYVGELAFIFVLAIASVGLMLLTGFTGLVSLGHAARAFLNVWGVLLVLGVGVLGIVVPLLLHARSRRFGRDPAVAAASVLILLGGFILRVVVVLASEGTGVTV